MTFITRNSVKIHYEIKGDGPVIVQIPGLGANIEMQRFCGWADAFPEYRLILVDPRGHGVSDKPKDRNLHQVEEYRDDVLAVLDVANVDRAVFWGISDGINVCCAVADAYPDRFALIDHDGIRGGDLSDSAFREYRLNLALEIRTRGWSTMIGEYAPTQGFPSDSPVIKEFQTTESEMAALEEEEWAYWKGPVSVLSRLKLPIL